MGKKQNDDPRNALNDEFFRNVALLRPRFFVMENVDRLLHLENIGFLHDAVAKLPSRYVVCEPFRINAAESERRPLGSGRQ